MTNFLDDRLDILNAADAEMRLLSRALAQYKEEILIDKQSQWEHEKKYGRSQSTKRAIIKHKSILLRHTLSELNEKLY